MAGLGKGDRAKSHAGLVRDFKQPPRFGNPLLSLTYALAIALIVVATGAGPPHSAHAAAHKASSASAAPEVVAPTKAAAKAGPKPKPLKPKPDTRSLQVIDTARSAEGVTLHFKLAKGPFPCPGKPYTDDTTIVFIPKHFRATGTIDMLVHFHGHHGLIAQKMLDHDLREQVYESGRNIVLVMPQGPQNATDSSGGKLEGRGAFQRFLDEVLAVLKSQAATTALASSALGKKAKLGAMAISSHSGGYKVTAKILNDGGYPVREIYLFDSLYGELDAYLDWLSAKVRGRKLISWYVIDTPARLNKALMGKLRKAGVKVLHEPVEGSLTKWQLMNGRAIFIHTDIQHGRTPYKHHNMRDALFASAFRRSTGAPQSDWYKLLKVPRPIVERKP